MTAVELTAVGLAAVGPACRHLRDMAVLAWQSVAQLRARPPAICGRPAQAVRGSTPRRRSLYFVSSAWAVRGSASQNAGVSRAGARTGLQPPGHRDVQGFDSPSPAEKALNSGTRKTQPDNERKRLYSSVVERQSCKLKVLGSIPSGGFCAQRPARQTIETDTQAQLLQNDAHAGGRTRVTRMEGLYDAATLRAP